MIDRNDIDALLIGALYGELTPADEARLSAHLESHPTDRSALDGLRSTREAVRESRFLAFQVDPPQAISALLLQEAARRAPKMVPVRAEKESEGNWFSRFVRSFAAHPAMAAAAMLVMVVGVGGLLYSRNGASTFSDSTVDERAAEAIVAMGSNSPAMTPGAADLAQRGESDGKAANDTESFRVGLDDDNKNTGSAAVAAGSGSVNYAYRDRAAETKGIVVHTPDPTVKDFADQDKLNRIQQDQKQKVAAVTPKKTSVSKKTPSQTDDSVDLAKAEGTRESVYATAPTTTTGSVNGPTNAVSGAGVATNNAPPPPQQNPQDLLAWAKDQHAAATKAVKAKNCAEAARLASMIGTRVPEYYNANIVNDRALKACQQYIANEREKDAEQSNKARAQKRLDANEVSPSPSNK